jgi:hypothetical protein
MARQHQIGTHATRVEHLGERTYVRYHNTNVVEFDSLWITLNNGGYFTTTTKTRMNQTSRQFNLGFNVYQRDYVWYVDLPSGDTIEMNKYKLTFPRRN